MGGQEKRHRIEALCLEAEESALEAGPELALRSLEALTHAYPDHPAPSVSLARLHRWMALGRQFDSQPFDRGLLQTAVEHAKHAVTLESPPGLVVLELLSTMLHMLAKHEERASIFRSIAERHPDPETSFRAFGWASVALQCRGMELEVDGGDDEAGSAYRSSVEMHRQALQSWPEAPVSEKLLSYHGGSHTAQAYLASGLAQEWVVEVERLLTSEKGSLLPGQMHADYLCYAGEMAVEAGLCRKATDLAERALQEASTDSLGMLQVLGSLLIAHHADGNQGAAESAAKRIECTLSAWEDNSEERDLPAAHNLAARTFVRVEDWDRAIRASSRAAELSDFGPNHWFLAVSLWAGRKDRDGALRALRNAARDRLLSGKSHCRNLGDDFRRSSYFRDVRDDPEFLAAVEVTQP